MRAEIGEPLQRERRTEREELPPVAGCGYSDPRFDPMAEWTAREAAKPKAQAVYGSIMPGVEAMPNWREFVGWVDPTTPEQVVKSEPVSEPPKPETSVQPTASKLGASNALKDDVDQSMSSSVKSVEETAATVVDLELSTLEQKDELSLDLGNLDMESVIAAAASAVDDEPLEPRAEESIVEPASVSDQSGNQSTMIVTVDEPSASLDDLSIESREESNVMPATGSTMVLTLDESPVTLEPTLTVEKKVDLVDNEQAVTPSTPPLRPVPEGAGLSSKLASVRPLAHPGRLPRKFELTEAEKEVLRLCNGRRTSQAILDSGIDLDGSQLTAFMKRCAQVKLVTFKR